MDVRPGYKRTPVGVIPEHWEVKPLQTVANIERGKFTARPRNDPKYYGGEIPFIQTGDVSNSSRWITTYSQTLNPEGLKVSKLFPQGTLFFTIAANIGDVAITRFATACPDSLVSIAPARGIDKQWLAYELAKRKPLFEILASHNAQLNINLEKLRPYLLPVPTLAEQEAIAEALSDTDALIESLEQLLTKKRQIKKGAMQELLTGKKRLSGFRGAWATKRIDEISDVDPENLPSKTKQNFKFNYISLEQVDSGRLLSHSKVEFGTAPSRARRVLRHGDVLMSTVRPNLKAHLLYLEQIPNAVCSTGFAVLRTKSNVSDPGFLFAHLFGDAVNEQIEESLAGSNYPAINSRDVRRLQVACPPDVEEQTAIATVLSDMDAEITSMEAKLSKARLIKQGMMQELLTGKVRLV